MATAPSLTLTFPESDIAAVTFDTPGKGANVLSRSVLDELEAILETLEGRDDLAGVYLVSGKPGIFIAGADLNEFVASLDAPDEEVVAICRRGQTLFSRFAALPFVSVAAIDGICVGGGAELACWCDRRIMSDSSKTEIGFPEVKLGLFPGWGGTVRAPRIAGVGNAVELITGGESIGAAAAQAMGLVTDVVPVEQLGDAAVRLIRDEHQSGAYRADRKRWSGPVPMSETELGFLGATASAVIRRQTKGQYPAPEAALEVILEGVMQDAAPACELEAAGMARLFGSPINAALLNVFFLTDRNKKDRGIDRDDVRPRDVEAVGVVGAGIMGAGIAAANLRRRLPVVISDAAADVLRKATPMILNEAAYDRQAKTATTERMAEMAALLKSTSTDTELTRCDLLIEAVVENVDVKRSVLGRLEPQLDDSAILATNTSTIPITQLARHLARPEQFCGIHFFNPVRRMKLVEIIRGDKSSDETIATAVRYAKQISKIPIVVNDGPGFLVNRLLFPYMHEALELVSEGADIQVVERAAKSFGMPMGPIELYDMVGIDTAFYAGRTMWEAFPDRIVASPILPAMVKVKRLGRKTGRGFYSYENRKQRREPDPELADFLKPYIRERKEFTVEEVTSRLFLPMLLEATRVLEDGIVRNVRDIDLGLIFGLGFPPFRGGLMFWADRVGAAELLEQLKPLESVGERMAPTRLLEEVAASGKKFYDL